MFQELLMALYAFFAPVATLGWACVFSGSIFAQPNAPASNSSSTAAIDAATPSLKEVTVEGTKSGLTLRETPASVEIIRHADSPETPYAIDSVYKLPNVTGTTRSALPAVRGLDGNGIALGGGGAVSGGRPRLSTYVDGVARSYSYGPDGQPGGWDTEQVEFYRGAQSTLFGRNSLAGGLIVKSRAPQFQREFAAQAGWDDQRGNRRIGLMANTPVNEALALRLSHDDASGDRFVEARFPLASPSAFDLDKQTYQNTKIAGLLRINPDWQLTLRGERERSRAPFLLDSVSGSSFGSDDPYFNDTNVYAYFKTDNDVLSARLQGAVSERWRFDGILAHQRTDTFGVPPIKGDAAFLDVFANGRETSFEPKFIYRSADSKSSGVIGAFVYGRSRDEGGVPGSSFAYAADDRIRTVSLFGDGRTHLGGAWTLLSGARLERENQRRNFIDSSGLIALNLNETARVFLPKIGIDYQLGPNSNVGAMAYKGYNAGGGGVSFLTFTPYTFKKEFSNTLEAFYRAQSPDATWSASANLFYSRYKDQQIDAVGVGGPEDVIYTNVRKSHSTGLELQAAYRVNRAIELRGGFGLLRARLDDFGDPINNVNNGKTLPSSPRYSVNLGVGWRPHRAWLLAADLQKSDDYFSSYANLAEEKVGGATVLNLKARYNHGPLTLTAYVNNATDRVNYLQRNLQFDSGRIATPRTVGVSARVDF